MKKTLTTLLSQKAKISFSSLGQFFADPVIATLCQMSPLSAGIATYFGGKYTNEQYETLTIFVHLLSAKLKSIEELYIDMEFFNTPEGKRIIGKVFRGILRDNRIEKIEVMSNLTVNLFIKSKLNIDEKEIYVDILDGLNTLQLSILQMVVIDIKSRDKYAIRNFAWNNIAKVYESKGVTEALLLQSLRTLESNGLINDNSAQLHADNTTHFVTKFGE